MNHVLIADYQKNVYKRQAKKIICYRQTKGSDLLCLFLDKQEAYIVFVTNVVSEIFWHACTFLGVRLCQTIKFPKMIYVK